MQGSLTYRRVSSLIFFLTLGTTGMPCRAQEAGTVDSAKWTGNFQGMLAGWAAAGKSGSFMGLAGIRYIPRLTGTCRVNERYTMDGELSLNAIGSAIYPGDDSPYYDARLKPYRMWVRFSGDRFEVRAGLQKINFGSATLLRPLMWFDQIDPRDPLQLTDGVYGLLGRYYFLNNANIWVWGLYGNKHVRGWETVPPDPEKVEYGSRFQVPVSDKGELAMSYHHRYADYSGSSFTDTRTGSHAVNEHRLGFDGKFDLGPGLWFEAVVTRQNLEQIPYRKYLNLGTDYTFGLGNGLNLMAEHFIYSVSDQFFTNDSRVSFTAVSLNYPLNIFVSLSGIIFYDWKNEDIYNFASCSLQFDRWSFYIMGFLNPENFRIYSNIEEASLFAGKGMQFMLVFNH